MPEQPKPAKRIRFEPSIMLNVAVKGQIVSCTREGEFEGGEGDIKTAELDTLPGLLTLMDYVNRDEVKCIVFVDGGAMEVPLWLALHLDALNHAGRLEVEDVPPAEDSASATENEGGG